MSLPKITYDAGAGLVTLTFKRGPLNFGAEWVADRVHDNVSSSGAVRERVVEALDIVISFEMPALLVGDDLPAWRAFMGWAAMGGGFKFYPSAAGVDYYNCVEDTGTWSFKRVARGVMSSTFKFRVLNDAQAPADPGSVMEKFYA